MHHGTKTTFLLFTTLGFLVSFMVNHGNIDAVNMTYETLLTVHFSSAPFHLFLHFDLFTVIMSSRGAMEGPRTTNPFTANRFFLF